MSIPLPDVQLEQRVIAAFADIWEVEFRNQQCMSVSSIECEIAERRMINALKKAGLIAMPKEWISVIARDAH